MVSVYFLYHCLMRSKGTPRIRFAASLLVSFQDWLYNSHSPSTVRRHVWTGLHRRLVPIIPLQCRTWDVIGRSSGHMYDPVSIAFSFCDFLSYTCLIHIFLLRFSAAVTRRTGNGSCSGWSELFWWNSTGSSANSSNGHAINNSGPQKARYYY